jgi:hypothetical protein
VRVCFRRDGSGNNMPWGQVADISTSLFRKTGAIL